MKKDDWRERLSKAVEDSGRSMLSISVGAGVGKNYLFSILSDKEPRDPSIEHLMKICDEIPVSLAYILYGYDITPEDEAILTLMKQSPEARDAVLTLLKAAAQGR